MLVTGDAWTHRLLKDSARYSLSRPGRDVIWLYIDRDADMHWVAHQGAPPLAAFPKHRDNRHATALLTWAGSLIFYASLMCIANRAISSSDHLPWQHEHEPLCIRLHPIPLPECECELHSKNTQQGRNQQKKPYWNSMTRSSRNSERLTFWEKTEDLHWKPHRALKPNRDLHQAHTYNGSVTCTTTE